LVEKSVGVVENSASAKVFQIFAGQKPPNPPPPSSARLLLAFGFWVNMPTTRVLRGRADEEARLGVGGRPGLADDRAWACWPKVTVWAAVPLMVVISIAY